MGRKSVKRYDEVKLSGFKPRHLIARNDNQKKYIRTIHNNDICLCHGPPGTGKTHVACGLAVELLKNTVVERICIARPIVGTGKDMGYLPGTMQEKIGPYLVPLFDELSYYLDLSKIKEMLANEVLQIVPLSMMRGRTFNDSFIILDEAQNATIDELKMLLTRIGENSKMVLSGDLQQSDLKPHEQGAFRAVLGALRTVSGIGEVALRDADIVRHPLIAEIAKRLTRLEKQ
jgi:phosphate starvation-inducible PhoH-like protein